MRTQRFTAKTKSGKVVEITAQNTMTGIETTYPVKQIKVDQVVIELTPSQAADVLNIPMPTMPVVRIELTDYKAWLRFVNDCIAERVQAVRAANPRAAQRQDLVIELDRCIDNGGDVAHPASARAIAYRAALQSLQSFDAANN